MATFNIDYAMKAQHWEITKGHLRAMVSLQGSYSSGGEFEAYGKLETLVEEFITAVEDNELAICEP